MRSRFLLGFTVVLAAACAQTGNAHTTVEQALRQLVDSVAADPDIPGALLYAYAPSIGLEWSGAAGTAQVESGAPLTPEHTFRNASNTKTYVAAAVLRLWEMEQLDLDALVRDFLSDEQTSMLAGDGYDLGVITLRQLLSHASGLADHGSSEEYAAAITADPSHRWRRDEQIAGAVTWEDPLGPAGQAFSYSDTGYILLGQVIERVTGRELGPAVRDLIGFDRLGLDATWWEIMEPVPSTAGGRTHQYAGGVDTNGWNGSIDAYGGGGLITSSRDLARFWYALFDGQVFERQTTLDTMLTSPLPLTETPYRLGVFVREFDGRTGYEHSGFWGTRAVYVPTLDLVVAGAVTEQTRGRAAFAMTDRVVALISAASEPPPAPPRH